MAEPPRPAPAKTYGKENWIFIPAIASAALAPTVAEATAASGLDITNTVFADAAPDPSKTTNRAQQGRRFGDTSQFEFIGSTVYTGGDIQYAVDTQAAPASAGRKMWETIPDGTTGFLARRQGVARATAVAAGQTLAAVYPVEFGPSDPKDHGDAEASESGAMATFAITGQPKFMVVVLA